jgi:hypothetical protein
MVHENNVIEVILRWQDEYEWQLDIVQQAMLKEAV